MTKLDLGSGESCLPGWTGVDVRSVAEIQHDLDAFPYPWETSSVDAVRMCHSLEHTVDDMAVVQEVHRILKPGGVFWIKVPHVRGIVAFGLDHKHYYTRQFFVNICRGFGRVKHAVNPMFKESCYRIKLWQPINFWVNPQRLGINPLLWEKVAPMALQADVIEWKGCAVK